MGVACALSLRTGGRHVRAIRPPDILSRRELRAERLLRARQSAVDRFC